MKYVADQIFVTPDETPTSIRKKVAQRLGVSPSSLRVTILSRQWRRGITEGCIELTVEAETNEFIHNTTFFPPDLELAKWEPTALPRRPVVVGFGLRGVLTAYLLARLGLKPIVVEKGKSLAERDTKTHDHSFNYAEGEGGASVFTGMMLSLKDLNPTFRAFLAEEGIRFEDKDAFQYLPTAFLKSFVAKLHTLIEIRGGEIFFETTCIGVKSMFSKMRGVIVEQNGQKKLIRTGHVIFCDGSNDDEAYLGCSVESSTKLFNQFVYGKAVADSKLPVYYAESTLRLKSGRAGLLHTGLIKPTLMDFYGHEHVLGQTYEFSGKGKNAVSYVGVSVTLNEAKTLMREGYDSSKPFAIPYSTITDFFFHKDPLRLGTVKPYRVSDITLTSMNRLLGNKLSPEIEKALQQFGKAFPYLLEEDALVGGMIILRGKKDAEKANISAKEQYFVAVSARKSLDFSAVSSACYQCVSIFAHPCKTH